MPPVHTSIRLVLLLGLAWAGGAGAAGAQEAPAFSPDAVAASPRVGGFLGEGVAAPASGDGPVFELRIYTTHEGKLPDLDRRFREHTTRLFERHGMTNVGYWLPSEPPRAGNTLICVLAHPSREAAERSWAAFRADPEWVAAVTASEANGPIVAVVESVFMNATDYSPIP